MDPISFTASLVAILAVAGSAARLSRTLYRIAKKAGPVSRGIQDFAKDMTAFASILQFAHKSLNDRHEAQTRSRSSFVIQSMGENALLDNLIAQSKSVMDHIELVRPGLKSIKGSFDFITRVKWHLRKTEIEALSLRVESVKTNLVLVICLVNLEAEMQREPSAETRQQIKNLERQIRLQLRTIRILGDQIERNNFNESHDLAQPAQEALIDLGQRMTRNSRRSRSARSTSFHESSHANHVQQPQTPSSSIGQETPPPRTRPQSIISGSGLSVVPNTTAALVLMPNTPTVRNSSSSLNSSHSRPISTARNEGDFVSVRPIDNVLQLSEDHSVESITGYINGVYITAKVNHEFDANVISQAEAVRIGLEVQAPGENNVLIKFGDHQERGEPSVGTADFEWSEGPSSTRRPFPVHCLVCTHNIQTVILGRPFVERLAHYWPPRSPV